MKENNDNDVSPEKGTEKHHGRCGEDADDDEYYDVAGSSSSSSNDNESRAESTAVIVVGKKDQCHQDFVENKSSNNLQQAAAVHPSNTIIATNIGDETHDDNYHQSEEAYRLRVYGTTEKHDNDIALHQKLKLQQQQPVLAKQQQSSLRRLSRQLSNALLRRQSSSIVESLPETPAGWAVLVSTMASTALGYEVQLQKRLTCPPLVYGQCSSEHSPLVDIYKRLTATPDSILRRDIQPSLFVGTRGVVSSTAGYLLGGPGSTKQHVRFRQHLTMAQDGAEIGLDWELPILNETEKSFRLSEEQRQQEIRIGPIQQPVVLILHGMNNDSSFGYVQRMMRTCTNRGWVAVCMNFRGCGGVPMTTPRGYSGAYTGDLRHVVHHICARLTPFSSTSRSTTTTAFGKLFIVGHSLSANIVCKYLGEEGLSGTLPKQVAGSVLLSNPMFLGIVDPISSVVLALGVKKTVLESWSSIRKFSDAHYQSRIRKAILAPSILDFDNAMAPIFIHNESVYPFAFKIGYKNGQEYYHDASSYRHIRHITVPTLQLIASDDFLVYPSFKTKSYFSLANPNVMVVETKCGGHLGWQESAPHSPQVVGDADGASHGSMLSSSSWSDAATADFIQAVTEALQEKENIRSLSDKSKGHTSMDIIDFSSGASSLNSAHPDHDFIERPPPSSPVHLHSRL
jgi:predicted alpha/beta-fold hydrolase